MIQINNTYSLGIVKKSLVSIIIPVHNRFALVDEAVRSCFEQIYHPIELILVDDHSDTPYTPRISTQPGFEIKILRHEENKGPGASRETGRQAATGDYIAYLDSDDLWHPQKLEKQVASLQAHPEAGMCYCQSAKFSSLPITGNEPIRNRSDQMYSTFLPAILYGRPWGTSACLWRREAIDKIGTWLDSWTWEDYEYECRAGCLDISVCFIPEVLCYYRSNHTEGQLSQSTHDQMVINRAKSIFAMSSNLKMYSKLNVPENLHAFERILHYQAMHSFYLNEVKLARQTLRELLTITSEEKNLLFRILLLSSHLLASKTMGGILYRLRNSYTKGNNPIRQKVEQSN